MHCSILLVPSSEALYGAATFDDDDLYTNTMMPLQLPGSMFPLLLGIKGLSEFQSNSSSGIVPPLYGFHERNGYR
jgi:hypothetical protein